jgi:hypothetical protein
MLLHTEPVPVRPLTARKLFKMSKLSQFNSRYVIASMFQCFYFVPNHQFASASVFTMLVTAFDFWLGFNWAQILQAIEVIMPVELQVGNVIHFNVLMLYFSFLTIHFLQIL